MGCPVGEESGLIGGCVAKRINVPTWSHELKEQGLSLKKRFIRKLKAYGLVLLAGKKRAARWNPNQVDRILVFRFDRIGDMVVTTPFLAQLERGFPAATIEVLCSPANADVLEEMSRVRAVVLASGLFRVRQLLGLRGRIDLVIDLNHSVIWRDLLFVRILQPRFAASVFKEGRYGVLGSQLGLFSVMAKPHPLGMARPLSKVYLDLAEGLGCPEVPREAGYVIKVSPSRLACATEALRPIQAKRVYAFNQTGSRSSMSLRDEDALWAVERILLANSDNGVVWLTTEQTRAAALRLASRLNSLERVLVWRPTQSVMDAAAALTYAKGLVTPDTSLVHFACAVGLPLFAVYANEQSLFEQWQPLSRAWTRVIFSRDAKSLDGYSQNEFQGGVDELLRLTQQP